MIIITGIFYSASGLAQATLFVEHFPQKERPQKVGTITWLSLGGAFCGTLFSSLPIDIY